MKNNQEAANNLHHHKKYLKTSTNITPGENIKRPAMTRGWVFYETLPYVNRIP